MEPITFSNFHLFQESKNANDIIPFVKVSLETFINVEPRFSYTHESTYYDCFCEKNDEFITIYLEYGKTNPRRSELVDIVTGETAENQRLETQTELSKQSFFLYYFSKNTLFLSKSNHQSLYQQILKDKIENDIIIKHIFIDIESFVQQLKNVNKITFSSFNDLYTSEGDLASALTILTGTNSPTVFTIEADYDTPVMGDLKNFIRRLGILNKESKVGKLIISGVDDKGFSTYFNLDTFTQKITVRSNKTTEGIFDYKEIFQKLLIEINNERY